MKAMLKEQTPTAKQHTADSRLLRIVSSLFILNFIACHETCLTCDGPDADDCLTCDTSALLYLKKDGSCGSCATKEYPSSGVCTDCHAQCATCTTGSNSIPTDGCVCVTKTNMVDLTCVASCPAGTFEISGKCYGKLSHTTNLFYS